MKYLKLFENIKNLEDLIEEIKSISYIMEDEKIEVRLHYYKQLPSHWFEMRGFKHNGPLIEISLNHNYMIYHDFYLEWKDRLEEICTQNGFKVNKYRDYIFQVY